MFSLNFCALFRSWKGEFRCRFIWVEIGTNKNWAFFPQLTMTHNIWKIESKQFRTIIQKKIQSKPREN